VIRVLTALCLLQGCSFVLVDEPCDTGSSSARDDTGDRAGLRFQAVGTGATHSCGILDSGALMCWGLGDEGQLDVPDGTYAQLAVGHAHACAVDDGGAAQCWGRSDDGQTELNGAFIAITAGGAHSCGLDVDGQVLCVGSNDWGQLDVPDGRYQHVVAGANHTCALTDPEEGRQVAAVCWGSIESESIGKGTATALISGMDWACAEVEDTETTVSCIGEDGEGQHTVPEGLELAAASAGAHHACGIDDAGAAQCWGDDSAGQQSAPDGPFLRLASGPTSLHTCGILDEGDPAVGGVLCWGLDAENQLSP